VRTPCPTCGRSRGIKDRKTIVFRTLFGKLELVSPRLRRCPCQHAGPASISPLVELLPGHAAPELLYLESKWSSLVSYGLTVKALQDFLPVDTRLNATSVRRDALSVARRLEMELGPEPRFPLAGCAAECASLPAPPAPITVGIDGGYLRHWVRKQTHFVAIVGESVPTDGPAKRFGFVQSHDPKPRRHLAEVLRGQNLQHNQELVFLSDGEDSLRQLQYYLRPHSQHLLDWFHLTKQVTGLGQFFKGLARLDAARAAELQEALEHAKWNLWHGKVKRALELLAVKGVSTVTAACLLLTAGDNPERLRSDAAFAHLAWRPSPASSGKTTRHRSIADVADSDDAMTIRPHG
jgi:Transposase IS116/IS110/IS902 family